MHRPAIALTAVILALSTGLASASEASNGPSARTDRCAQAPREQFRTEAELAEIVERLGYRVVRVGTDAGCFAVLADDRRGKRFDLRFDGASLRMVSRYFARPEAEFVAQR